MRDHRVGRARPDPRPLLDEGGEGRRVLDRSVDRRAEPLVQAVYEEVLRAGGLPIMQLQPSGAQAAFFELASDEQLDWVAPTTEWAVRERRRAHLGHGVAQHARALAASTRRSRRARRRRASRSWRRRCGGRPRTATAGRSRCSPRTRTRARRACRCPPTRTSTTRPAWRRTATRCTAWERQSEQVTPAHRVDPGQGGGAHPGGGHRHHARRGRPQAGSPAWASTTCPTASSSPARSRTR